MPSPFRRTLRSLDADGTRGWTIRVVVVLLLLAAWGAWFALARVSVYAVTPQARIEAEEAAHPLEAPVAGRITAVSAGLEDWVERDQVLFELDSSVQRRLLDAQRALRASISTQIEAVERKMNVDTGAVEESSQVARAELEETRARYQEAQAGERFAVQEAERLEAEGLVAESESSRARAEADQRRASTEALRLALDGLEWARRLELSDRRGGLDELQQELARLQGDHAATTAAVARLEFQVEERRVKAPTEGRIGELARIEVGSFVEEGDRLGAVIPAGAVKVVADFSPASAVGRISRGQSARIRLDGFPSIQYGALAATVSRVSSELRDGRIRVELEIADNPPAGLPLQHGLPGTAEVEVERISPAVMVLRAAGKLVGRPTEVSVAQEETS
jgi:membrane fusion protein (multidrug efflux system)